MKDLENVLGKHIPAVDWLDYETFGFMHENNRIIGLGFFDVGMTQLPETIGKLTNLTHLDIGDNRIKTLPDPIGNLTKLKELLLNTNNLKTIPDSISNLKNLERLRVDRKSLSSKRNLEELEKNGCLITLL